MLCHSEARKACMPLPLLTLLTAWANVTSCLGASSRRGHAGLLAATLQWLQGLEVATEPRAKSEEKVGKAHCPQLRATGAAGGLLCMQPAAAKSAHQSVTPPSALVAATSSMISAFCCCRGLPLAGDDKAQAGSAAPKPIFCCCLCCSKPRARARASSREQRRGRRQRKARATSEAQPASGL